MKSKGVSLTDEEKRVAKAMLAKGMRSQDVHAFINAQRPITVNFGRIAGIKKSTSIVPATNEEVEFFKRKKNQLRSYHWLERLRQ